MTSRAVTVRRTLEGSAGTDRDLVAALRSGDEASFRCLVDELSPGLLRMARIYVATDGAAQEVVQETWLGVIQGLDRFEGRARLKMRETILTLGALSEESLSPQARESRLEAFRDWRGAA